MSRRRRHTNTDRVKFYVIRINTLIVYLIISFGLDMNVIKAQSMETRTFVYSRHLISITQITVQ
jgi:hypothetical protein